MMILIGYGKTLICNGLTVNCDVDDPYFKCQWLVPHMRYLQAVFCFWLLKSQSIISDQNGHL